MQVTFFGTHSDLLQVARWLLDIPGMKLFEPSSRPDLPNQWFGTIEEVAQLLDGASWSLGAWLEPAGGRPEPRSITFDPMTQKRLAARGRTELTSPALIGINGGGQQNGCLAASWLSCWSEKGARERSGYPDERLDDVDWKALESTVAKVQRTLKKAAPAKLGSIPIMGDAFRELESGRAKLWNYGSPAVYPSPEITLSGQVARS